MLVVSHYSKKYFDELILEIPYLSLPPGIHWIKGQNGAGKSTLFKSIAGIIPFTGDIHVNGLSVKSNPVRFRRIVNYGDAEPLYPGFVTAKDLIGFTGRAKKSTAEQQNDLINIFGIKHFLDKPCESYSSGMLKKLSLVLAFLGNPAVILLDEPLITLDEETRVALYKTIGDQQKERTILISSHQDLVATPLNISSIFTIAGKTLQSCAIS